MLTFETTEGAFVDVFGEGTGGFPVAEAVRVVFGIAADLLRQFLFCFPRWDREPWSQM